MSTPLEQYWNLRLENARKHLVRNRFAATVVPSLADAADLVMTALLPASGAQSVAFGGSMTVVASGLVDRLKATSGLAVLDTYDVSIPPAERIERRRQALLTDLFITSTNALTTDGRLVNLDGTGNRVAALAFGPKNVIVLTGRNKLCDGIHEAFKRVRQIAAPANTIRLSRKTPCVATGICADCQSPDRICNTWTITAKSCPDERVHVILINEDLGY